MTLAISASNLLSRVTRSNLAGRDGLRKISMSLRFSDADDGDGGGLINRLFRPVVRFLGWAISGIIRGLGFSATKIFQWFVNGVSAVYRFDWNRSDAEIRQLQRNNNLAMASIWGSFVGQGLGWLAGIAVGAGVAYLCPVIGGGALARTIAASVGTEALSELYFGLRGAVGQTIRSVGSNSLLAAYMQVRRLIKRAPPGWLEGLFGEDSGRFLREQWGNEGGPDMSLANLVEERTEAIGGDALRVFVESLLDESWDNFMEAGFIVAAELDEAYAQHKQQELLSGLGPSRGVELTPDREANQEMLYLEGPERLVKQQAINALNTHRMVYNRDMGQIVGQPAEDWYRARFQRRQATIVFRGVAAPPWRESNGNRVKEASYSIPDCRSGVSWADLKSACRPYQWGEWRATAKLDNGRQMAVYGATSQEAQNTLERLLRLSTASIIALNVSQEKIRNIKLKKYPTQLYPAFATLLIRIPSTDAVGRTELDGDTWDQDKRRWAIWRDEEPDDFVWR